MLFQLFWSASLLHFSVGTPLASRYVVKETHRVPDGFTRVGDAPSNHRVTLQVGLKQDRFEELERHLYEVSDPDHSRYGQHLSQDEVTELVKPSEESLELVREWLHEHVDPGAISYSEAKDFLSFTLPLSRVESILDTKYSVYRHVEGFELVRTPEWKLPLHLHEHVTAIQPTTSFLRPLAQRKTVLTVDGTESNIQPYRNVKHPTVEKVCNASNITPLCLRTLYGTVDYKVKSAGENQIGLNDFLGEINNRSDAKIFLEKFRPKAVAGANQFKQVSVHDGTLQQTPENKTQIKAGIGLEGGLDVQTILGITWPTPLTAWSTGGSPPFQPDSESATDTNEPYLTWLNYILAQSSIPQVISNSYEDDEQTVPSSYAHVVCSQFAQLGARGVSVFFGSGDGGVSGVQAPGSCKSNVNNQTAFIPLFPSSCPYVTSVGATVNGSHHILPEVVAFDPRNNFSSGGGFSNYFKRPSYQKEAVSGYLNTIGDEFSSYYNKSGRAYPDLAAYGVSYAIIWNGALVHLDGTSAATPTAASVFALLNDALLSAGKPAMGFLNPWLYKKGKEAFVDVTNGSALGCNTTGFQAVEGWDAVSGWGTPRFHKLLKAVGR